LKRSCADARLVWPLKCRNTILNGTHARAGWADGNPNRWFWWKAFGCCAGQQSAGCSHWPFSSIAPKGRGGGAGWPGTCLNGAVAPNPSGSNLPGRSVQCTSATWRRRRVGPTWSSARRCRQPDLTLWPGTCAAGSTQRVSTCQARLCLKLYPTLYLALRPVHRRENGRFDKVCDKGVPESSFDIAPEAGAGEYE
jgi:hypothetical protein